MSSDLSYARRLPKKKADVYVAHNGVEVVGWSLIFQDWNMKEAKTNNAWTVHVYVRRSHRSNGIGRQLYARTIRGRKELIQVYAHDARAEALYARTLETKRAFDVS